MNANDTQNTAAPMRLRADPPRVTRLSRKVLAGIGLAAGLGIGGALIHALQKPNPKSAQEELFSTERHPTADGLEILPGNYASVPQLGPPLPGDIGRPILQAREQQSVPMPQADPNEQRRLAEMETARTSKLFFQTETPPASNASAPSLPTVANGGVGGEDRHRAFLSSEADRRTVAPDRLTPPTSPYVLQAGSVIPAALITGIRSDLPGRITAQVTQNIYDSPTGRLLLIPQGARLIGDYDSGIAFGQSRVLLAWNRLILPNGHSIVLERQPGADTKGFAGLEDGVDRHWVHLLRGAVLSTLIGAASGLGGRNDENDIARAIRDTTQNTTENLGQRIIGRQLDVQPTLTIRPGFPVRVIVTRDLVLEPSGALR